MLIPAAISLIISAIFLNFNFFVQSLVLTPNQDKSVRVGRVLGASEEVSALDNSIGQNSILNKTITRAIGEIKALPVPRLYELPELDKPIRQLSKNQADRPAGQPAVAPAFDLAAENGVILDCQEDNLFYAKRPDRSWPIASITKLFTAYTFLDYNPGWETSYKIKPSDKREGGKIYLFSGDEVTVKDLFYFSLVGSDNTATAALVQTTGLSEEEFVKKINEKIKELGLKNTRIVDSVGLRDGNISTAREVAGFAKIALAKEEISRASLTKKYEFNTIQGKKKVISSTDELLNRYPEGGVAILGGKTGYVNSSGYCLVSQFKNDKGRAIITVVLGADSDSNRFKLTKKLVDLYYNNQP